MEQNAQLSSDKDSLMLKLSKLEDEMKKLKLEEEVCMVILVIIFCTSFYIGFNISI